MAQSGPTLATAYIKLVPTTKGFKSAVEGDSEIPSSGSAGGASFGKAFASMAMKAIAIAGIGKVVKDSIGQGAELQQSLGGVETLFKNSANTVKQNASNAWRDAGVSANEYMQQVTSFSASLISSLNGDTAKSAQIADVAMKDMSDNANKFGTDMTSIQYAYQGFAKQNYTMLDNLKLGYGGTKSEMQRLLADAEKMPEAMGRKFDLSNYSDVIEAVHVVQQHMGVTGTTAKEAQTTLSGSLAMMKASWNDLVGNLALGNQVDFSPLLQSANAVFFGSGGLMFMVGNIGKGLAKAFVEFGPKLGPALAQGLRGLSSAFVNALPSIQAGVQSLASGLLATWDSMLNNLYSSESLGNIANMLVGLLGAVLEGLANFGLQISQWLATNLPTITSQLLQGVVTLVTTLGEYISQNGPSLVSKGLEIIYNIAVGIVNSIPVLLEKIPEILNAFAESFSNGGSPIFITKGVELLLKLLEGILKTIPTIVASIPKIVAAIVNVIISFAWNGLGVKVITFFVNGIRGMIGSVGSVAGNILNTIVRFLQQLPSKMLSMGRNGVNGLINALRSGIGMAGSAIASVANAIFRGISSLPSRMASIGSQIVRGIWSGISNMTGWIMSLIGGFARSVISSIKGLFGIHSPSRVMRDEVGIYLAQGIGVGIENGSGYVNDKMERLTQNVLDNAQSQFNGGLDLNAISGSVQASASYDFNTSNNSNAGRLDALITLTGQLLEKDTNTYLDGAKVSRAINDRLGALI